MNGELKCGKYLRLSKEDMLKGDESSSISSQRMIIESFAKFNNFNIVETYIDDGYSGGNYNRPGFIKMIEDIKMDKINCVITKDLARLGRELYETGGYIEDYFIEKEVRYIAINDSYDSKIGDSMLGIRLGVNDLYLRDVSKRVKTSIRAKQEAGLYIGSIPCYGYIKNPENRHQLIPDKKVVPIIKMIYQLALEGYTIHAIKNRLTEKQIPIPIIYKKETRGRNIKENDGYGIWKYSTVKRILTSQMYIGNMVQRTYEKVSYRSSRLKQVPKEKQIIVENTHEGIINKEIFNKVQRLLDSKAKYVNKKTKKHLFIGLLKCKECGSTISISKRKTKRNNSHHTQCNLYRKKGKYGVCSQHRLNYNWLEEDLIEVIINICKKFIQSYDYKEIMVKMNLVNKESKEELKKEFDILDKEIFEKQNIIDSLYKDKVLRIISISDFSRLYKITTDELDKLNIKKSIIEAKIKKVAEEITNINYLECQKIVEDFMSMKNITHNIITKLINKIEINESNEVDIYFNFKELSIIEK